MEDVYWDKRKWMIFVSTKMNNTRFEYRWEFIIINNYKFKISNEDAEDDIGEIWFFKMWSQFAKRISELTEDDAEGNQSFMQITGSRISIYWRAPEVPEEPEC